MMRRTGYGIGLLAVLLLVLGATASLGRSPGAEDWAWQLAPKTPGYVPDPQDITFYYPLPEVVEWTSPFGDRIHPLSGDRRLHAGVDLGAPEGMPVLAAHGGYVRYADWGDGYGNLVIVEYADGQYQTYYAHLSQILVREGEAVRPRQVIGLVGSTGGVTGPHLHFELRRKVNGDFVAIDPSAQVKAVEAFVAVRPPEVPQAPQIAAQPSPAPWQAPALPDATPSADIARAETGTVAAIAPATDSIILDFTP